MVRSERARAVAAEQGEEFMPWQDGSGRLVEPSGLTKS